MSNEMNCEIKKMLDALDNDINYISLKQKYDSPNPFTIMGNKRREEWHSNFVRWILDPKPKQNHKLGTFPLLKFLELVESKNEKLKIDKKAVADMKFENEHKTHNGRKIDIFGISPSLVLIIENKIKADETKNKSNVPQSNDYYKYGEEKYNDRQRCYVLLKRFSTSYLENDNFIHITYQDLYDKVIKPSYEYCKEHNLEDTKRVLEQYILDISNPFTGILLAATQKEISSEIYEKHKEIIEIIRNIMTKTDRDDKSDICTFFVNNIKYLNDIILKSLGRKPIIEEIKKLRGDKLVDALLDYNYIIPNETELIYEYKSSTCIIMVDNDRIFHAGYYPGNYDGSQDVDELEDVFYKLHDAQLAVEEKIGSNNSNGGASAYTLKLLKSGIKEAEGKMIGEIMKYF